MDATTVIEYVGAMVAFSVLELVFPGFQKWKNPLTRKFGFDDILFLIANIVIGTVVAILVFKLMFYSMHRWALPQGFRFLRELPWAGQVFIAVLVRDFMGYCMHRFSHCGWFWKYHVAHHESEHLDALMSFRVHPVNFLLNASRAPLMFALGFHLSLLPLLNIIQFAHNIFVHTNIRLDFGPLNYIFVSPAQHRVHHAASSKLYHHNYGVYFSFWDRIFGTWIEIKNPSFELGIEGHTRQNFVGTITAPFRKSPIQIETDIATDPISKRAI